jgi:hypothetical protein
VSHGEAELQCLITVDFLKEELTMIETSCNKDLNSGKRVERNSTTFIRKADRIVVGNSFGTVTCHGKSVVQADRILRALAVGGD